MTRYSRITGTGSYLPPRRVTNAELVADLASRSIESSNEWIVERTGIQARHFADAAVACSDLALEAARHALQAASLRAQDIDLIIVATSTPDMVFPSTAAILQHKLGASGCPAFDVQAVCSGFVYALTVADAMIRAGTARQAVGRGEEGAERHQPHPHRQRHPGITGSQGPGREEARHHDRTAPLDPVGRHRRPRGRDPHHRRV